MRGDGHAKCNIFGSKPNATTDVFFDEVLPDLGRTSNLSVVGVFASFNSMC